MDEGRRPEQFIITGYLVTPIQRGTDGMEWGGGVSRYRLQDKRQLEEERRNGINSGAKHEIVYYVGPIVAENTSLT